MKLRCMVLLFVLTVGLGAQMPKSLYPWWSNRIVVRQLNLSNAQVQQIRGAVSHFHPQLLEDRAKVLRAEQNLEDQFNSEPVDQAKTNQAIEQLIAARSGLTRSLSGLSLKLRMLLSARQWQDLQRLRPSHISEEQPAENPRQK